MFDAFAFEGGDLAAGARQQVATAGIKQRGVYRAKPRGRGGDQDQHAQYHRADAYRPMAAQAGPDRGPFKHIGGFGGQIGRCDGGIHR